MKLKSVLDAVWAGFTSAAMSLLNPLGVGRLKQIMDEDEARRIMDSGLGRAELEFVTSICAPLYWVMPIVDDFRPVRNGTAFFLNAGDGVFAVTADHVLTGLEQDRALYEIKSVQLGVGLSIDFAGRHAVIDHDADMDIATFRIAEWEVAAIGKTILTGYQDSWPPKPPQQDRGVYFSGFAGVNTRWLTEIEISFGAVPGSGLATSVGPRDVSTQFERQNWIDVLNLGLPPEDYDFGGISGGPMLSVIEQQGLRTWSLAGVIYQGPNSSADDEKSIKGFEVIKARHASFIRPDGTLDRQLWSGGGIYLGGHEKR